MRLQSKSKRAMMRMAAGLAVTGCAMVWAGPTPRLTPKPQTVRAYPAPSVPIPSQAGVLGPYGVGLAAAAPIGTPYLRSPAFAGPSIIYMPQSVTRVLVPGVTPYPSNLMQNTDQYIYSSAPFNRTDVYVNLPYGGFYRPQGFAGTTPVEPQVPAYIPQPISAVLTAEAAYTAGNFASEGPNDGTAEASLSVAPVSGASSAGQPGTSTIPAPADLTSLNAFPPSSTSPGTVSAVPSTTPAPAPARTPEPSAQVVTTLPSLTSATSAGQGTEIIVDDSTPGGVRQDPPGSWSPSVNVADSYEGRSLIAKADGTRRAVTFLADIPADGRYEVALWFVVSNQSMRSTEVPVTVNAAEGPVTAKVDQVDPARRRSFVPVGTYELKAGQKVPVITISTEGLPEAGTIYVSADAVRLVKVQ